MTTNARTSEDNENPRKPLFYWAFCLLGYIPLCIKDATLIDGAVDCDYFLECVLPINPDLNRIIWAELLREEDVVRPNEKTCAWCGGVFIPRKPLTGGYAGRIRMGDR